MGPSIIEYSMCVDCKTPVSGKSPVPLRCQKCETNWLRASLAAAVAERDHWKKAHDEHCDVPQPCSAHRDLTPSPVKP
jgi:hypothetical protein